MAKPSLNIETRTKPPLEKFKKRLEDAHKKVGALSVPMKKVSVYLDRWVQDNFKTEGGKVGGWQDFARGGRLEDGQIDTTAQLLQDTGRGRASFTPFATKKDAGIGSDLPYMRDHDKGENGQVQRRILPELDEVEGDVEDILEDHVIKAFKDEGFE